MILFIVCHAFLYYIVIQIARGVVFSEGIRFVALRVTHPVTSGDRDVLP